MKKINTFIIAFCLAGIMTASVSYATFEGGGASLGTITALFAKLDVTNLFTKDQTINDPEVLAGGTFSGVRVQTTERASYCLGPSDGSTREYCMSGGNTLMLHGSAGSLYDGPSTGTVTLISDSSTNRHWYAPSGSIVMAGGSASPIGSAFMIGSNINNAATFIVDTTNDWMKLLPITAPAATECDEADERGRIYYDSGTDKLRYCNGTAWMDL
jgi:hypothetical protein